ICLADFLGSLIRSAIRSAEASRYYRASASLADLPAKNLPKPFNDLFRQVAELSLLRLHIACNGSIGILTDCPSATPLGLALGPDLPAVDYHCRGTLSLSVDRFLTCLIVTYAYICFPIRSTKSYLSASPLYGMLPYHCTLYMHNPKLRYYT